MCVSMPSQAIKASSRKELQVPSIVNDPSRNLKRIRRLAEEEDHRAEEEVQPIVNMVDRIAWSVACVVLGWIIALI